MTAAAPRHATRLAAPPASLPNAGGWRQDAANWPGGGVYMYLEKVVNEVRVCARAFAGACTCRDASEGPMRRHQACVVSHRRKASEPFVHHTGQLLPKAMTSLAWDADGIAGAARAHYSQVMPWARTVYHVAPGPQRVAFGGSSFGGICTLCMCMK